MKKKLIMTVAATSIALTIGTITSFAGEAVIETAGDVLNLYPVAQTFVAGTVAVALSRDHTSTYNFAAGPSAENILVADTKLSADNMEINEMNDIWDTMSEREKDNVYNCLKALTASPSS